MLEVHNTANCALRATLGITCWKGGCGDSVAQYLGTVDRGGRQFAKPVECERGLQSVPVMAPLVTVRL